MTRNNPLKKIYVKELPPEQSPYKVDDDVYKRFDQRNNLTVGRPTWDEGVKAFTKKTISTRVKKIGEGQPGFGVEDYSLFEAGGVTTFRLETAINHANRGFTSWATLGNKLPTGAEKWSGSPQKATQMVKRVARYFGAELVGIAPLDRRWIFSHAFWTDGKHKQIVFDAVDAPIENEDQMVIPENMQWVIVMAAPMDPEIIQYTPSPLGCAETRITYSRMGLLVGREGVAHRINAPAVALHARMTVEDFSQTDLSYAPPFGPTWDPCLTAANQLLKVL